MKDYAVPASLSVHQPPGEQEEEIDLQDLFPDPEEFCPPSPTFTFPPLPETPPEIDETETITSSTGTLLKTEIEVLQVKEVPPKPEKKHKIEVKQKEIKQKEIKPVKEPEKKRDKHSSNEKKKLKNLNQQLKVPQVQITQQISSEREIVDSICLTKSKLEKKDEKYVKTLPRKGKKRKEKKESMSKVQNMDQYGEADKDFCGKCYQKKSKRKKERAQMRAEEHLANDQDDGFIDRQIEEKEVLRRYIVSEKLYDDTISIKSYGGCSIHGEERESPHKLSKVKLEQVRDAVLVVRNWKHSTAEDKHQAKK